MMKRPLCRSLMASRMVANFITKEKLRGYLKLRFYKNVYVIQGSNEVLRFDPSDLYFTYCSGWLKNSMAYLTKAAATLSLIPWYCSAASAVNFPEESYPGCPARSRAKCVSRSRNLRIAGPICQ